ncbi:DMT family transporter [Paenibacillus aurantius]|uniref:DMT family transporter n=1 Tax=Paenibacillus aurantius TaxID=2918900 RepID=A0AA96LDG1_9BACL|nr:DMT family transporter [Paenibacillus aurantius]WNQ11310.1 DMT family transporter [Paenibacillus aurantius]
MNSRPSFGLLYVAMGAALWGTDALLRTPLLGTLTSAEIVLLEHVILLLPAGLFLLRAQGRTALLTLTGREWALLLLVSWGSSGLATWLFTEAFRHGNPSVVLLLQKLQPLFAVVTARLLLEERLPRFFPLYLGTALVGAYLLSFGGKAPFGAASPEEWRGSLLALGAALLWGGGTAFGRRLLGRLSFADLAAARFVLAVPFLAVLLAAQSGSAVPALPAALPLWLALALLALVPGALGMLLYYRGLRDSPASYATLAELCFPASALLLNAAFLGQGLTWTQGLGAGLVCAVVAALPLGRKRVDRSTAPVAAGSTAAA